MLSPLVRVTVLFTMLAAAATSRAGIIVTDDTGEILKLEKPAARIVSLAPHLTELMFAAGAGSKLIAADEFSDYPEAAKKLQRIGSAYALDLEALLALKPDLIVAWKSGNDARQLARLRGLGIRIFLSEPRALGDIARSLEIFGALAGTETVARPAADRLRAQARQLESRYRDRSPVRVFFQIWSPPIMTINSAHFMDAVLKLCGGQNVFGELSALTPTVTIESVVAANPEVILASDLGNSRPAYLDEWLRWPRMAAVRNKLVAHISADLISRPGPRIFDGAATACGLIDRARAQSPSQPSSGNKQP